MTPRLRDAIEHVKHMLKTEHRINVFGRFVEDVGYLVTVAEATENCTVTLRFHDELGHPLVDKQWKPGDRT